MPVVAKLHKWGSLRLDGNAIESLPAAQKDLIVHFPMDGSVKPAPIAIFNADNTPGVTARHPVYGDLFKVASPGTLVTVPGLGAKRYAAVEFDVLIDDTTNGKMPLGFLTSGNGVHRDLYYYAGALTLNGWNGETRGAAISANQRIRVTFVIDCSTPTNSRLYLNGVSQTMTGTAPPGSTYSDQVVLFNGRWDASVGYFWNNWMGNIRFYSFDSEDVTPTGVELDRDGQGVFVGQTTTNLLYDAGVRNWSLDGAAGTLTEIVPNDRYQFVRLNTGTHNRIWIPLTKFTNGETYTLSFKWKPVTAGATISGADLGDMSAAFTTIDMGGYLYSFATASRSTYDSTYRFWDIYQTINSTIEVWDICMENKFRPTMFNIGGRTTYGKLAMDGYLPSDHSIVSRQRHILDSTAKTIAVTKSGNTFKLYEDGTDVTATYQSKWRVWTYHRPTVDYSFAGANNIKAHKYDNISPGVYSSFSAEKVGFLARTYLYSDANVRIWHRYGADNGGRIRVNGRDEQGLGGWDSNTNPDVYIDLKVGWNVVELWGMDGDSGGTIFTLVDNSGGANTTTGRVASVPFYNHPNVKFMTSVCPVDFWNAVDGSGYTHGVNSVLHSLTLYGRAFTDGEAYKAAVPVFSVDATGSMRVPEIVEEEPNMWPDPDVTVFNQPVRGNGTRSIGTDDGRYYQVVASNQIGTYTGYDVTTLESGAWYVWSAEVWRSVGSTPSYVTLAVEQAVSPTYGPLWSTLPEATWVQVEAIFTADASVRLLTYPTGSTAGSGTFRWRNVQLRKLPTKLISSSPTLTRVGEIVEY